MADRPARAGGVTGLVNRSFAAPPGWASPHLQTLRSRLVPRHYDIDAVGTTRLALVDVDDGSGDRLCVAVHEPLYRPARAPLVVLIHGLGGSAESSYVRACAVGLLRAGYPVARVDLRGAGRSAQTSVLMYHAGRTQDVRAVLGHLAEQPEAASGRRAPALAVMGFSLGGNATLKLLGEPLGQLPVMAGVAVSAPLDLDAGTGHLEQAAFGLYEKFLIRGLRRDSLRTAADGRPAVTDVERDIVRTLSSIREFDDAITARRNGWADATEYYRVNSAGQFLPTITVPTLVIHAVDDPMVPVGPYLAVDWDALAAATPVRRAVTAIGGHVGFHRVGGGLPWYVSESVAFLRAAVPAG